MILTRILRIVVFVIFILMSHENSVSQDRFDVIYLKSGSKIIGKIIEKTENQSIRVELRSKEILFISWDNIKAIEDLFIADKISTSFPVLVPSKNSIANDTMWEVISKNRVVKSNLKLDSLKGAFLYVSIGQIVDSIEIVTIKQLQLIRKSRFVTYAGLGTLIGASGGAIIGALTYTKPSGMDLFGRDGSILIGGVIGAAAGFTFGGILGAAQGANIVINIPDDNVSEANSRIREIFLKENYK